MYSIRRKRHVGGLEEPGKKLWEVVQGLMVQGIRWGVVPVVALLLLLARRLVFLDYRLFAEGDVRRVCAPPTSLLSKLLCVVYQYLGLRRVCRHYTRNLRGDGMLQVSCEPEDGSTVRWGHGRAHRVYCCNLCSSAGVDERAESEELWWSAKRTKTARNEGQMDKTIRERTSRA